MESQFLVATVLKVKRSLYFSNACIVYLNRPVSGVRQRTCVLNRMALRKAETPMD
ncbi:hypothetical protein [Nostoc sp. NMS1]|uniref:hypothetical protein n=1 Tax=Nostoc sp. NMS1 TaxID=2815388 RepID=UPI0025FDED4D|nr:hypothetical protein [Nostoc sp. NMS1]